MGKKRKVTEKKKLKDVEISAEKATTKIDLFGEEKIADWMKCGIAVVVLWMCALLIFNNFIFADNHFNLSGDNLSAAAIARMGQDFQKEGQVPNWCPYIFCGMPLVGSLIYVNHYYWAFYPVIKTFFSIIFLGSDFGWLFIHFMIAGLGIFCLLKYLRVNWVFSLLFGILFAYNQTMVVYADVGHGSKVMTMAYLPWLLYFIIRLYENPRLLWFAWLAFFFGWQLRAQHVQIVYYGVMMMGLYAIYAFIAGGKAEIGKNVKSTLLLSAAGFIGLCFAAPVYLQILEYNPHIIRGGGGAGSAAWDYATQWSFHPLESLTYIFPSFFGFGRETYWGFMPFTDMPYYWGGLVLLFAPWAVVYKRDRLTWYLVILAAAAWIVSFGNFLPVLYWPLYELLPYFDKFRVPSLIQILVFLPAVILAGRGLQVILEKVNADAEKRQLIGRIILRVGIILAISCVVLLILQGAMRQSLIRWALAMQPRLQAQGAQAAMSLFTGDILRLLVLGGMIYGSIFLILNKKYNYTLIAIPVALFLILETYTFDKKLIRPGTPKEAVEQYLAADDVVQFLKKDEAPFRFYHLTGGKHPNWYMPHRLESISGYSATRMKIYQEAVDSVGLNNPALLKLMNVRYLISDRPITHGDLEEVFVGQRERVYHYKRELPRAFLVDQAVRAASPSEVFDLYRSGTFDFSQAAVLEEPHGLSVPLVRALRLDKGSTGSVTWVSRTPDYLALDVESSGRQLLFLSEVYYPSGWKASLDGVDTPILKTNFLFRGVEIPAGKHRVELSFKPKSLVIGNVLQYIALTIILAIFALTIIHLLRSPAAKRT